MAALVPLSPDEAYYWVWAQAPAAGYLDHPPMVALWIAAGTALAGDGPLGVRLLAPPAAAAGSLLLAQAASDLVGGSPAARRRAGILAAALANATLLVGIGAATMTPDTPLLLFWTATLWALGRLHATGRGAWWLVAGLAAGLALCSKYTAALLVPVVLLWLLAVPANRRWLARPQPWAAALLALALFAPVLAWNAAHGWAGLAKQAGRGGDWTWLRAAQFELELLAGQVGLLTPLVALLAVAGLAGAVRRLAAAGDAGAGLLVAAVAVPGLVFIQHGFGARVEANWPGVICPAAAIAAAGFGGRWLRLAGPAVALGAAMTLAVWLQAAAAPFRLPLRIDPTLLRLGGWEALAADAAAAARRHGAVAVAADSYGPAALMARLLPPDLAVVGIDARWRLFALPDAAPAIAGQAVLLLASARRGAPDAADWQALQPLGTLARTRGGMTGETFRLYLATPRPGHAPAALLPRPRQDRPDAAAHP